MSYRFYTAPPTLAIKYKTAFKVHTSVFARFSASGQQGENGKKRVFRGAEVRNRRARKMAANTINQDTNDFEANSVGSEFLMLLC
jgi:hypothetical protein